MGETISKMLAAMSELFATILATTKTHKWWWAGGGGAAAVAIVATVVVFGGFFGPSGKAICTVALEHAREYGVIPSSAKLSSNDAKSTDVKNRKLCTAEADGNTYNIAADVETDAEKNCKDITKNKDCVALYSVERADGLSTYQLRQVPDDDTDAPPEHAAANDAGGAPAAPDTVNAQSAPDAGDIQPATGTHAGGTDQQTGPQ